MPYTPPASGSPSASYHNSPPRSPGPRPQPPRSNSSASYLTRHRRSPSLQDHSPEKPSYFSGHQDATSASVRQSPQPVTDSAIPAGAIISPPDSNQNSSDDEDPNQHSPTQVEALQELTHAVRSIEVDRHPASPANGQLQPFNKKDLKLQLPKSATKDSTFGSGSLTPPPRGLSSAARKISHSRSATEGSVLDTRTTKSAGVSRAGSDESDEDSSGQDKPPLLRKKSGELVKPAIRPSCRRKHSSMPGTPTYSKAVHFNDDIEQVRHFLQVDRPIAVSAGTSPVDGHDEDSEFPFGFRPGSEYEWEILLSNFPRDSFERLSSPVRLEQLFLSADQKRIIGVIAVANLAFHKTVAARFTLDYWKTTSEVLGEFNNDTRQQPRNDGYDQFNFSIKLSDLVNLESKTLFICVRYQVNGNEYWDNNNSTNYQVDFIKKQKGSDSTKSTSASAKGPKSIPRSSRSQRPRSVPSFDDDFSTSFDSSAFDSSAIKLKNPASSKADLSDNVFQRKQAPSGQQFGSRYDFGASLSAALAQAQAQMYVRSRPKGTNMSNGKSASSREEPQHALDIPAARTEELSRTGYIPPNNSTVESPRPDALLANNQTFDSRAYQDFVSKFCFFGSSTKSANHNSATRSQQQRGNIDGADDDTPSPSDFNSESSTSNDGKSAQLSGASSPLPVAGTGPGPRAASPVSFGYPFTADSRSPSGSFTPESYTPTAIQG